MHARAGGSAEPVLVLRADLRQPAEWIEQASLVLPPDELEALERGTPDVARRRIVARVALRVALADALSRPPQELEIEAGAHGKPALADNDPGVHFNLARSGDCCLIAISAVGPVGVDVEQVRPVPDLERIAESRFTPAETRAIAATAHSQRLGAFLNCWTRKEAYLKAIGCGLAGGLDSVEVTVEDQQPAVVSVAGGDPTAWSLSTPGLEAGLVGAVALNADSFRLPPTIRPTPLPLETSPQTWP